MQMYIANFTEPLCHLKHRIGLKLLILVWQTKITTANGRLRAAKAEERKEEVIKAQTPGPKTAEVFRQEASNKKAKGTDT